MPKVTSETNWVLAMVITGTLIVTPLLAVEPAWAEHGNGHERGDGHDHGGSDRREDTHFAEQQRVAVREYYTGQLRAGFCPPGLAKKHNGCMPPGQAKKWAVGHPLPRDVVFYDVPPALTVQLGPPPARCRYVRVGSDILLIAVGTGLILDAIEDLGGK